MLEEVGVDENHVTQEQIDVWYLNEVEKTGEVDLLRLSASEKPEHYVPPTETKLGSDSWTDLSPRGTTEIKALFGQIVFDNPKPVDLIRRMLQFGTNPDTGDIILDFFAGSCTTAQAVLEANQENGGNRRFIMVQLPEPTPEDSPARKAGYKTVAEVGKERIRRVIARMSNERQNRLDEHSRVEREDLGFAVFRLAESNFRPWKGIENKTAEAYAAEMEAQVDPLVSGWKKEDVIYEVALKEGYGLSLRIEQEKKYRDNEVWRIIDPRKERPLLICLDDEIKASTIRNPDLAPNDVFVCRDVALDDTGAANLALQCGLKTI